MPDQSTELMLRPKVWPVLVALPIFSGMFLISQRFAVLSTSEAGFSLMFRVGMILTGFLVGLFILCAVLYTVPGLTGFLVNEEGITVNNFGKRYLVPWNAIEKIGPAAFISRPSDILLSAIRGTKRDHIGFSVNWTVMNNPKLERQCRINRKMIGYDMMIPNSYFRDSAETMQKILEVNAQSAFPLHTGNPQSPYPRP